MEDKEKLGALDDTALNYKEHHLFFDDYYILKKDVVTKISGSYTDITLIPESFQSLIAFMVSCIAQLGLEDNYEKLSKEKVKIFKMITDKTPPLLILNAIEMLFSEICSITMNLELEPKPQKQKDPEEVLFWKDETHRGMRELKKGFMDVLSIKNG